MSWWMKFIQASFFLVLLEGIRFKESLIFLLFWYLELILVLKTNIFPSQQRRMYNIEKTEKAIEKENKDESRKKKLESNVSKTNIYQFNSPFFLSSFFLSFFLLCYKVISFYQSDFNLFNFIFLLLSLFIYVTIFSSLRQKWIEPHHTLWLAFETCFHMCHTYFVFLIFLSQSVHVGVSFFCVCTCVYLCKYTRENDNTLKRANKTN